MISENNGIKELSIFWNFTVDKNLPKFKKAAEINDGVPQESWGSPSGSFITGGFGDNDNSVGISVNGVVITDQFGNVVKKPSLLKRGIEYLYTRFVLPEKKKETKRKSLITILDFFTSLSKNVKHLTPIGEHAKTYEKAYKQAEITGQESLKEQITKILDVSRTEAHLIQNKLNQYVTEGQIIDLYEQIGRDKKLKLSWIKNFVKMIPSDLIDLKGDLDKMELFDNYVILHYDPNNDATNLTEEEIEVQKDPILFGLMENSRKLYYIGDWKDDYCDLTLEGMFNELGEDVLKINNGTLKTYINNGGEFKPKRKKIKKPKTDSATK